MALPAVKLAFDAVDSCELDLTVAIANHINFFLLLGRQLVIDLHKLLIGVNFHQGIQLTQRLSTEHSLSELCHCLVMIHVRF